MTRPFHEDLAQELGSDYELITELGRGGVSVVYLARERELGREVAIKVIRDLYTRDGEATARFEREARMLARLQHPNIVTLYTARRLAGGALALVMQYGAWQTLKTVIHERGPLPADMAEGVLRDIAGALAYLHRHDVIHRDIKPENIFVDNETGRALLSDFGLAKPSGSGQENVTLAGVVIGTPAYMSPEQIDGDTLDGKSDVYSLGMVGYEMLTGRRPWEGESLYNVIYKQKNEQLPPLQEVRPEVPEALCRAVHGAIEKDRSQRLPTAEAVLAALPSGPRPLHFQSEARALTPVVREPAALTAELQAIATSLEGPPPPRRRVIRRRVMLAAPLLLVLVAGAGAAAVALSTRPADTQTIPSDGEPAARVVDRVEHEPAPALDAPVADSAPAQALAPSAQPAPAGSEARARGDRSGTVAAEPREGPAPRPASADDEDSSAADEPDAQTRQDSQLAVLGRLPLRVSSTPASPAPGTQPGSAPMLDQVRVRANIEPPRLRNPGTVNQALRAEYPSRLKQLGIGGMVEVSVLVGPTGVVLDSRIARSSGDPQLDAAALKVARRMDFHPGTQHGIPSAVWANIPLVFRLEREEN